MYAGGENATPTASSDISKELSMKKIDLQTFAALGLGAGLAVAMVWFYHVLVNWNLTQYAIAIVVIAIGVILLTLLALHTRGEKKAVHYIWKTALSVAVFLVVLIGVSYIINNVVYRGAVLAGQAALFLCAAQLCVLFALLVHGMAKQGMKAGAAIAGIGSALAVIAALLIILLGDTGWALPEDEYFAQLDSMGIYANLAEHSLPQTAIFGIVVEHFEQARDDGRTSKALIIGFDGARADAPLLTADDPRSAIQALVNDGGKLYNMYCGGDPPFFQATSTSPGWTNLLTGRWAREPEGGGHGVSNNGIVKAPGAPPILHTYLIERALVNQAALVVSWDEYFAHPGAIWYHDKAYAEANELNINWVNVPYDGDIVLFNAGLIEIQDLANDFIMVTLDACDYAGHASGFSSDSPFYAEAFAASEHFAFDLIQAVKARATYAEEDWLIIVTSDHGGVGTAHGPQFAEMRQIFMAINKDLNL